MEIALIAVSASGWAFAAWSYSRLLRWAREIKGARIAVAYKKKVKIDAPLVEWLLWIRQAGKDKGSTGRMVYSLGGTSVIIVQRVKARTAWWMQAKRWASKKSSNPTPTGMVKQSDSGGHSSNSMPQKAGASS